PAAAPISDPSFGSHFDDFGNYKVVLLGDGSHGTSEFYAARAGNNQAAHRAAWAHDGGLEADWPTLRPSIATSASVPALRRAFGGKARDLRALQRPLGWTNPPRTGWPPLRGMEDCERGVLQMLRDLLDKRLQYAQHDVRDGEEFHSGEQNAFVVRDAERYYKAMYYSSASSWTLRDTHMFDTLRRLFRHKPADAKAIVWAHNSHCGDARYTSMGTRRKEVNIGQLIRENFGRENVAILGCGTHTGTVAAAHEWDEDMQVMKVRPSRDDSWEIIAHDTGIPNFVIDLRKEHLDPALR
ncbi:uncharacterized protein P174DRAFT_446597, partial [Aspergillus novofumigatus IBT 16806]